MAAVARGPGEDEEPGLSARVGRAADVEVELGAGATMGMRGRAHAAKREAPQRSTQCRSALEEAVILPLTIVIPPRRNCYCNSRLSSPTRATTAAKRGEWRMGSKNGSASTSVLNDISC